MGKAPAFQFYANDFMDATRFWEANAVGLYIRCLCIQWTQGAIPADLKILARGVGMDADEVSRLWVVVGEKFRDNGDNSLVNSKLEDIRARQKEVSDKRSVAGKSGANAKANAKANASYLLQAKQKQRKEKEKEKIGGEGESTEATEVVAQVVAEDFVAIPPSDEKFIEPDIWPTFEDFWNAYDKKRGRPNAEREWARLSQADREAVMTAVPAYVAVTEKSYRKDPERYLKHKAWKDEIIKPTTHGQQSLTDKAQQAFELLMDVRIPGGVQHS